MAVLARLDDGPAWSADGVRAETVLEQHALGGEAVDIGGGINGFQPTIVGPNGMGSVVIREKEQDVRAFVRGRGDLSNQGQEDDKVIQGEEYMHPFSHENL